MIPQLGTIWLEVKWSRFRLWRSARVLAGAQQEPPIRVTTHLFGSLPLPHITRSIKGWVAGRWEGSRRHSRVVVVPESFKCHSCVVVHARSVLSIRLARPGLEFIFNHSPSDSAFLHHFSTHLLWTPPLSLHPLAFDSTQVPPFMPGWSHLLLWTDASCTKCHKARNDAPAVREVSPSGASPQNVLEARSGNGARY